MLNHLAEDVTCSGASRYVFTFRCSKFFFLSSLALLPVTPDDPAADRAGHLSLAPGRRHRLSDTRWQVHRSAFQSPAALHPALQLHLPPDTHSPSLLHPPVKLVLAPSRRRTRTDHRMRLRAFMPHALTCEQVLRVVGLSSASSSTFPYFLNILNSSHVIG